MSLIKITMCHLKELKGGLLNIWKCVSLLYRGHCFPHRAPLAQLSPLDDL